MQKFWHLTSDRLIRFAPLLAAVFFGTWAAFVNHEYGLYIALRSGLGQAVYALFSTWIVSRTAAHVFSIVSHSVWGFCAGFAASFVVMISIPLAIHNLLGTPEIFNSILPGAVWGSGYIVSYLGLLARRAR